MDGPARLPALQGRRPAAAAPELRGGRQARNAGGSPCLFPLTFLHLESDMLVLSRRPGEQIVIGGNIRLTVLEIRGARVRLGIEAPPEVSVDRDEIQAALDREQRTEIRSREPAGPTSSQPKAA